jgi:hypothetical protein
MKKLIILGMFAFGGLMMSSCCNDYDCLIEKYSKSDDPKELVEIAVKIEKLQKEGKEMTKEQKKAFRKASKDKADKVMDEVKEEMEKYNLD